MTRRYMPSHNWTAETKKHSTAASTARETFVMFGVSAPWVGVVLGWAALNWHILYWALWIGAFLVVEIPAIFNARLGDTFSEAWWRWLRIRGHEAVEQSDGTYKVLRPYPLWVAIPLRVAIVLFGVWLIGHLGFGLWGGEQ